MKAIKKLISCMLAMTAIMSVSASYVHAEELTTAENSAYDFNLDGRIDLMDLKSLVKYYAEQQSGAISDKEYIINDEIRACIAEIGDINSDGKIDGGDVALFSNYLYGQLEMLPGDVDHDGSVSAIDASKILQYYAHQQTDSVADNYTEEEIYNMIAYGSSDGSGIVRGYDASNAL